MRGTRRQLLALSLTGVVQAASGEPALPSDRDAAVIAALLSAVLKSPDFVWDERLKADSAVLLHIRAPEKTGMLQGRMIRDAGDRELAPELVRAIRERNTKPGTETEGIETSFANLRLDPPVFVGDITPRPGESEWEMMRRIHPKAVAWASPWLPGYSGDGNRALARCWWGPWPHGATATAELERAEAGWKVIWIELGVYA